MKIHNAGGAFVTVEFEPEDVEEFASRWPCFNGPDRVSFEFERRSGDLVDMEPANFDGGEALAMSQDAWTYFLEHSNDPEPPEAPSTFREWLQATLDADQLEDLAQYGAAAGFPGLTYYSETTALYEAHEDEIWEALAEDAADFGHASPLELVASFNGAGDVHSDTQFRNLLCWYAAERVARQLAEEVAR